MKSKVRVAFDLDETLGSPIIDSYSVVGFNFREGSRSLLAKLQKNYTLILWTVSRRVYLDKVLNFGLGKYFEECYSWDEISENWKDVRRLDLSYLIDDSEHHRDMGRNYGLESRYIIIPVYGSPQDEEDPLLWVRKISQILLKDE